MTGATHLEMCHTHCGDNFGFGGILSGLSCGHCGYSHDGCYDAHYGYGVACFGHFQSPTVVPTVATKVAADALPPS